MEPPGDLTSELPSLAAVLNALPRPAILLNRKYQILAANTRYRETYGFSDKPVNHLCHEVSHGYTVPCDMAGETCPLKESLRSGENTRVLHIHHTPRGREFVNVEMWPVKDPSTGDVSFFIEQMHPSEVASTQSDTHERMVGTSPGFQAMLNLVERVAPSESNLLLLGESGTGKEMVAQTVHRLSARTDGPFVPVECTGLPDTLFESELFGYVKGAFTGATANKTGLVAAAEGGTLFLDEVGDIPLNEQVKLLRLLESRRYRKVGSNDWEESDFRLVCATNKDLAQMMQEGTFREDLYYRLNVFEIELPPLRSRIEDLPLLIDTLLTQLNASHIRFAPETLDCLMQYPFPGNVRELRNIVERAILLADDGLVHPHHLPRQCRTEDMSEATADESIIPLEEAERRYLQKALTQHKGSRKALAERLEISERVLYRKLADLRD